MILSDADIKQRIDTGDIVIDPYDASNVESASVDLRLGRDWKIVRRGGVNIVDTREEDSGLSYTEKSGTVFLQPVVLVRATTLEYIELPDDIAAHVIGRSTLGRIGVSIHQTAWFIDPGFCGEITLEMSNLGPATVKLYEGQRICQIVFTQLSGPVDQPYGHTGSQYQDQSGATESGMKFD